MKRKEKRRVNFSIRKDLVEWLNKNVDNASKFVEGLIEAAKECKTFVYVTFSAIPATSNEMTGLSRGLQRPVSGNGERTVIKYSTYRNDFIKWLNGRVSEDYIRGMDHYLDEYLDEVSEPKQIVEILGSIDGVGKRRWFERGFRNLLTYLEDVEGFPADVVQQYRKVCKVEKAGVREIYITDAEVIAARAWVEENRGKERQLLFKLLVASGARGSQILKMLEIFDPNLLIKKDEFARYPIASLSKGKKKGFWVYMPIELAEELERCSFGKGALDDIRHGRVNVSTIRKWHLNVLIEHDVHESVADFIQGRAAVTVGSTHYLHKTKQADRAYMKILPKIRDIL